MRDRMDAQNNAGWTPRGRAELAGGREAIVYEVNGVLDAGAGRARLGPMILVGQYDSPFVRRVGVSLRVLGFDYEHDRRSVFGDFDSMRETNPLGRIPSLMLEDGTVLIDSARSEEHTSELQSLMRISSAVFCLKKKTTY